jgi:hypothetical protein
VRQNGDAVAEYRQVAKDRNIALSAKRVNAGAEVTLQRKIDA